MLAVWYERNGEAAEVLQSGELETPTPATGEVRVPDARYLDAGDHEIGPEDVQIVLKYRYWSRIDRNAKAD